MKKNHLKYMELVDWIKEQAQEKKLLPGQKMYSENELSDMFHISRQTVRHAIGILEQEGFLTRKRGSGTYISDKRQANLENRTRICVVMTYVEGYIFPRTIKGIENVLFENGYSVQIAFTNNQNSREKTILEDIISRDDAAGVIMETTKSGLPNSNLYLYEELKGRGIPVIFINSFYPPLSSTFPHVSLNDKEAGKKLAQYLMSMGHRDIGGVFKLDDGQGHMRYAGYMEAMQEAGIETDDTRIVWIDTQDMKNLQICRNKLIERLRGCTAVICYNDQVSFELIDMLKKEGIRVPEDISIISVDDSELSVLGDVSITSLPHPMERLGEKAANNLLKMIEFSSYDGSYEFDEEITIRDSVKRR